MNERLTQMRGAVAENYFVGFSPVQRLLESYQVADETRFHRTRELVESGRFLRALEEHEELREDMVTGDLPILLAGNADLHFRAGTVAVPQPWRTVWPTTSFTNFREQTIADLNDGLETDDEGGNLVPNGLLPAVPEHHGYNDARVSEHYETAQIETYGATFSLTRQMLQNDDTRSLNGIPAMMGRTAARTLSSAAQLVLEANPLMSDGIALFQAATHGNLQAGPLPLALAALSAEFSAFTLQTMPSGLVHNVAPKYLIVPPALAILADTLVSAMSNTLISMDQAAGANILVPDRNPMAGRLEVVVFERLTNTADWYLAADANEVGTIEVAFLNGNQTPELFTQAPNVDLSAADGSRFKVREDFDVYPVNWAGLRKIVGA